MFNKVIMVGTLAGDVVVRQFGTGSVASFMIVTTESWSDRDTGEIRQSRSKTRVSVYDGKLIPVAQKFRDGDLVFVDGKLAHRKYVDNTGAERFITEVAVRIGGSVGLVTDGGGVDVETHHAKPQEVKLDDEIPF